MATETYKLPLDGLNTGLNVREQDYKTGVKLSNCVITADGIIARSGFDQLLSRLNLQASERILGNVTLGGILFVITTVRIVNVGYLNGTSTVGKIEYLKNFSGFKIKFTDFTDAASNSGVVLVAYTSAISIVLRVTLNIRYVGIQPIYSLDVTEVTQLNTETALNDPVIFKRTVYLAQNTLLPDGSLNPAPATPTGGAFSPDGTMVVTPPAGWSLGVAPGNSPVIPMPDMQTYASTGTVNPATSVITWSVPTKWIQGIGYVDNVLLHDGRLVFVNTATQTMFFSPNRNQYLFNGTTLGTSLITYPLGSFITSASPIADIKSTSISGNTGELFLNLFIILRSGQLLSFNGNRPPQIAFGTTELVDGTVAWKYNGNANLPGPLSPENVFVGFKNDLLYLSTQGVISVLNTLKLGSYDSINIGIQSTIDAIARSGIQIKASIAYFASKNIILFQINETTYVYNSLAECWTSWTLPTPNCSLSYTGDQLYVLDDNSVDLWVYKDAFFKDATTSALGVKSYTPIQVGVRIGYNPVDNDLYTIKNYMSTVLYFIGGDCSISCTVYKDFQDLPIDSPQKYTISQQVSGGGWLSLDGGTAVQPSNLGGKFSSNAAPTAVTQPTDTPKLEYSSYRTTGKVYANRKFSIGVSARALAIEFNVSTNAYFSMLNYDLVYKILRSVRP